MERIFGKNSVYSEKTRQELKRVMQVQEAQMAGQNANGISIYGKTGMGKAEGAVVDAWFTGFAEYGEVRIVSDYCSDNP